MNEGRTDIRFLILMYALAFILLWEWLLPVIELTDTEYIGVFLYFIALSFLFALLETEMVVLCSVEGHLSFLVAPLCVF